MAATSIGDLSLAIRAGLDTLKADLRREAPRIGDEAGATLGARMKSKLGAANIGAAIGATLAGGFALASKGALDMEERMARFQAETGASAEEARHFADAVNAAAGSSLVSMDNIAQSATRIRTDLGLTGKEADATLGAFLRFERATNQGADAVLAFDDILDAWNLDAKDSQAIMDVLIKSHQLYGGSIADNQRMLSQLAPALQAANMSWEEGQGLLNLFARAGVEAEAASTAFNRALGKVESPEELRRLLEDISATEDPFLRAQKAAELFGARAGTKLAQALSDANGDLGAFIVSVDDAAGATEKAAAAIDDTLTSKVRLAVNNALSLIRGFGMELGPVLTGAFAALNLGQALGLNRAMAAIWTAAGGSSAVRAAAAAAGAAGAKAYAVGLAVAQRLLAPLQAAWSLAIAAGSRVMVAAEAAGMATGLRFVAGVAKGLSIVGLALLAEQAVEEMTGGAIKGIDSFSEDSEGGIGRIKAKMREMSNEAGQEVGTGLAEGIDEGMAKAGDALSMTGAFSSAFRSWQEAVSGALATPIKEEFDDAADEVRIGFGNIKDALANPPQLISRQDRLENMAGRFRQIMKNLNKAVEADDPYNQKYWAQAALAQQRRMNQITGNTEGGVNRIMRIFDKAGIEVDRDWVRMQLGATRTKGKVDDVGDAVDGLPSRHNTDITVDTGAAMRKILAFRDLLDNPIVTPWSTTRPERRASGGAVQPGRAYVVGEYRPEMFIPTQPGRIDPRVSRVAASGSAGAAGPSVNLEVYGLPMRAETPLDVAMQTARAARLGYFSTPTPALSWRR